MRRIMTVAMIVWTISVPAWASSGDDEALLRLLIKKGVITEQEIQQVKEELKRETTPSVEPAAASSKTTPSPQDPSAIRIGQGTLKLSGLLQTWLFWDANDHDRFRIRRAEVKASGDLLADGRFKYTLMVDPVTVQEDNTRRSFLQDAYLTFDKLPWLANHWIDVGQYKLHLGEEGQRSSSNLEVIERSFIARTFGDQRDIGARLVGEWPALRYQLGVFNGSGMNQSDANDQKDLVGRIEVWPLRHLELFKKFEMGMSGYYRPTHGTTRDKKRLGFEARYEYGPWSVMAEYMSGQGTQSASSTTENSTRAWGWYAQLAYFVIPDKLQLAVRADHFDPNRDLAGDLETDTTLGLNYFLYKQHAKAQLNWVHKDEQDDVFNDQVIGAMQYAF